MDLEPGDKIPGPIALERVIYRRKSGVIWLATHADRGLVSVKVPSAAALHEDEELAERFRLESRATVEINSEHVVHVLEDGLIDGAVPFVVMEALEGEPLRARLEREADDGGPFLEVDFLYVGIAAIEHPCDAVEHYAHVVGLVAGEGL